MKKLIFNRTYVISLANRRDRIREFHETFPDDWTPRPIIFPAIDGNLCPPPDWWQVGSGAWGCLKSHMNILETCLMAGVESVLILEDDAVFCRNFTKRLQEFLEKVPENWEMIYLGGQLLYTEAFPPKKIINGVYRPHNVNRTHAYAVRGPMISRLYSHLSRRDWLSHHHIDHHYGRLCESEYWNIYCPDRWLVQQSNSRSDIMLSDTDRVIRMPDPFSYDKDFIPVLVDYTGTTLVPDFLTNLGIKHDQPEYAYAAPRIISVNGGIHRSPSLMDIERLNLDLETVRSSPEQEMLRVLAYLKVAPSTEQIKSACEQIKNPRPLLAEGLSS